MSADQEPGGDILVSSSWAREDSPVLISIHGFSGSGKTLSSLLLARGLAGPKGKVAMMDTERRRAKVHAGRADVGGVEYFELTPPFSPERYVAGLLQIYKIKPDVLVIDSASHEWDGEGGLNEIADASNKRGLLKWMQPKARHKKFMRTLLRAPCHVIVNFRSKRKFEQMKGSDEIKMIGAVPIQEFGFIYETTVQLYLPTPETADDGRRRGIPRIERCPDDLLPVFAQGEQISVATGAAVREWCRGGVAIDRALSDLVHAARDAAAQGVEAYRAHWDGLTKGQRAKLEPEHGNLKSIAQQADEEKARLAALEKSEASETAASAGRTTAGAGPTGDSAKEWEAYQAKVCNELDMAANHGSAMIRTVLSREAQNLSDAPSSISTYVRTHAKALLDGAGKKGRPA